MQQKCEFIVKLKNLLPGENTMRILKNVSQIVIWIVLFEIYDSSPSQGIVFNYEYTFLSGKNIGYFVSSNMTGLTTKNSGSKVSVAI